MRIAYINLADAATLTANPVADATSPVTYLQNDSRGYQFAAAASGSQEIKGEWGGTAYTISCVHLDRTSLADGDTIRIYLYSDAAWTTAVYDSTAVAPFTTDVFDDWDFSNVDKFFTPVANVKSFKIVTSSAAALTAARLYVGAYVTAEYNPQYGLQLGWDDNSEQDRREGGTLSTAVRSQWRSMAFDMSMSTEAYRAAWMEIGRYAGKRKSVWISVFAGDGGTLERDHSIMGKFEDSPASKWAMVNKYDYSLKLNEV